MSTSLKPLKEEDELVPIAIDLFFLLKFCNISGGPQSSGGKGEPPLITSSTWAQRLINLEIPVLVRSLKSSNVELG